MNSQNLVYSGYVEIAKFENGEVKSFFVCKNMKGYAAHS
jgi:hypothetical protein